MSGCVLCLAELVATQSGWLNVLKLGWHCLKFVSDVTQGISTEARYLSADVQTLECWISFLLRVDFLHRSIHAAASFKTVGLFAHCPDVWSIYSPRLCLEFYQPMYVRYVVIQTAAMHLDTEAFNNRKFPNVLQEERSCTADHINENITVRVVSIQGGEQST